MKYPCSCRTGWDAPGDTETSGHCRPALPHDPQKNSEKLMEQVFALLLLPKRGKLGSRVTGLIKDRSGLKLRSISNASFFFMGTGD